MVKVEGIESGEGKRVILIDGEPYVADYEKEKTVEGVVHTDKIVFKKFDKEKFQEDLNVIIKALEKKTTTTELLKHILKDLDMKTLRRLANRIRKKKPIKKQKGCLGFKVGDAYVQLVD